jgi:hypothetical protein
MTSKFIFLPTFTKKSDITFHKKSDYPKIDFDFTEKVNYSYQFKETPNSSLHQIFIRSEYTWTSEETNLFCRFDIVSPFEINKYVIDLSKDDFNELAKIHIENCKEVFDFSNITFPDGLILNFENFIVNSEYISLMLIDFRTVQSSITN